MAGKKSKAAQGKGQNSAEKNEKKGGKGQKKSGGGKTKKAEGKSKSRFQVDIFTQHCMENAYYICHNVQDVLRCRGFPWPYLQNKKKKGKKGK